MKPLFLLLFCIVSLILTTCNKIKEENTTEVPVTFQKVPFTPPYDSSITIAQMKKWLSCNPRLDSLSYTYLDSFKTEDAESRLRYQQNFINTQDVICVQQGLTGGYDEYVWILKNLGNRKNKPVLDALKLKTF